MTGRFPAFTGFKIGSDLTCVIGEINAMEVRLDIWEVRFKGGDIDTEYLKILVTAKIQHRIEQFDRYISIFIDGDYI